jgi:hypothetical protein
LGAPLLKQRRSLFDQRQFRFQLLDSPPGCGEFTAVAGRDPWRDASVDEVLGFPPVHRGLGQAQLGGALYLLADELTRMQELARIEAGGS